MLREDRGESGRELEVLHQLRERDVHHRLVQHHQELGDRETRRTFDLDIDHPVIIDGEVGGYHPASGEGELARSS